MLTAAVVWVVSALGCSGGRATPPSGTMIEEFGGFPIFHGDPQRDYRVLGPVYDPLAAVRGPSPMKRAAVAEARRLGGDAILLTAPADVAGGTARSVSDEPESPGTGGPPAKWRGAVAIDLIP